MMQRRTLLIAGIAGILTSGIAPAVVTKPMKLWVPTQRSVPLGIWELLGEQRKEALVRSIRAIEWSVQVSMYGFAAVTLEHGEWVEHTERGEWILSK